MRKPGGSTVRRLAVAGALGVAAGGVAAWAYYTPGMRVLAHSFVAWIGLLVAVSARRSTRQAIASASALLVPGVIAFYLGKDIGYELTYPDSEHRLDVLILVLWCLLGAVGGFLLGATFARVGAANWPAAAATALAAGLLVADTAASFRAADGLVLIAVAVLALGVVAFAADRTVRQWRRVGVLLLPAAVVGYVMVRSPDLLEAVVRGTS